MCTSVFIISLLLIGAAMGSDDNKLPKFRFYDNSIANYTELTLEESHKMFSSPWYNRSQQFFVFAHGFTGHPDGPAVTAIITAFLKRGDTNVALLNWEYLASKAYSSLAASYISWAVPNALKLGADLSDTFFKFSEAGLDLNKTHLVGHSLGAHLFGVTGNKMAEKGVLMPWITGLDPAMGFDLKPQHLKLNPKSALFTSTIHTDPSKYGSKKEVGLVNFWPNYRAGAPVKQPGCTSTVVMNNSDRFTEEDFCSHHRSWQLFIDAMQHPGTIMGSHATSFRLWKRYDKSQREAHVLDIAAFDTSALPGNYYFITKETAPYGLGLEGLKPQ